MLEQAKVVVTNTTPLIALTAATGKPEHVLYDLKYLLPASGSDLRL